MPRPPRLLTVPVVVVLVVAVLPASALARKKSPVDPSTYQGVEAPVAAAGLLELARQAAEDGSWENIAIGRTHLLAGRTTEAEAIFDRYDSEPGDLIRIGRAYLDAGDWPTARGFFEQVLRRAPEDEDWLAEIGSYYNVQGDRATAEELFRRSFEIESRSFWNLLRAAASYDGVLTD